MAGSCTACVLALSNKRLPVAAGLLQKLLPPRTSSSSLGLKLVRQYGSEGGAKGRIAAREPFCVHLKRDKTYFWCRCGLSGRQPFCDGSHKGTEWTPVKMRLEEVEEEEAWLCGCKQTDTPPYCDGTHATPSVMDR